MNTYKAVLVGFKESDNQSIVHLCNSLHIHIISTEAEISTDLATHIKHKKADFCFVSATVDDNTITGMVAQLRLVDTYIGIFIADSSPSPQRKIRFLQMDADAVLDMNEPEFATLVLQREMYNQQMRKSYQRTSKLQNLMSQILRQSVNEIYLIDAQTLRFYYANEALLDNLNYSRKEFLDLDPSEMYSLQTRDTFSSHLQQLLKSTVSVVNIRLDHRASNGDIYPVQLRLEQLNLQNDHFILGIAYNVREQIQQDKVRDDQRTRLETLELNSSYKSEFLATLSHEMRTTLTSVIMLSDILRQKNSGNLTQEQIDFVEIIQSSNNGLLELLNQVLDLSKIDSGKMSINLQEVHFKTFLDKIERLYTPLASQKKLGLNVSIAPDMPDQLVTDPIRLEQVLKNLISNALKFTHRGHISLLAEATEEGMLCLHVSDTGIGITDQAQSRIFTEYEQEDSQQTFRNYGGTGLGLSISRKICKMLGGDLSVTSVQGKGSTFTAELPLNSRTSIEQQHQNIPAEIHDSTTNDDSIEQNLGQLKEQIKPCRVLLVDDSPIHNMALREFLSFSIKECVTAETASEAYEVIEKSRIDCVVLDMYLPDASGREVLRTLKSQKHTNHIPVIIYSGKSLSASEKSQILEEADALVPKNVSSYKILLNKILQLTEERVED